MKSHVTAPAALLLLAVLGAASLDAATPPGARPKSKPPAAARQVGAGHAMPEKAPIPAWVEDRYWENGPFLPPAQPGRTDTTSYLPDTTILARVENRVIRVGAFRQRYFGATDISLRPASDSAGRAEFLQTLVDREILALAGREYSRPFEFTQRADMRAFEDNTLQAALMQRTVLDSIRITEDDVTQGLTQFDHDLRLRHILFGDRTAAERVRLALVSGRMSWSAAVRHYSVSTDTATDGDLGWVRRVNTTGAMAVKVFSLKPGALSEIIRDDYGYNLYQVVEQRKADPYPLMHTRRLLLRDLRSARQIPLLDRLYGQAAQRVGASYDTANIRWLAQRFVEALRPAGGPAEGTFLVSNPVPYISHADTGRVLVRSASQNYSVGQFFASYSAIPSVMRRKLISLEPLVSTINGFFLGPELQRMASELKLDRDPYVVSRVDGHRDKLMVENLYSDSILSHISVTDADRAKYFREHPDQFRTVESERYAQFIRYTAASADSLANALSHGADPVAIHRADSLANSPTSLLGEIKRGEANQYVGTLWDLQPGEATRLGPDSEDKFLVLYVIDRRNPRPMTFQESEQVVDESLRNIQSDRLLTAFLRRHSHQYHVEIHSDLLMKIRWTDPILD